MKIKRLNFGKVLIFVVFFAMLAFVSVECASATEVYVPDIYEKIQWAVNNATAGDSIIVRDGTYPENVDVNVNNLTICSENGSALTIVHAANPDKHVFKVTADYVNIRGFTVENATGYRKAGIYLRSGVDHCNISDNIASNNYVGIKLYESCNNIITGNNASNNNGSGILLTYNSSNNTITGNNASNNNEWSGIGLKNSSNNTIIGNTVNNNKRAGIGLNISSNNNNITGNTANNNKRAGIGLLNNSSNNTIIGNTASNSEWSGIGLLKNSSNNTIIGNTANNNKRAGIGLNISSNNNIITGNTASNNEWSGIGLLNNSCNNTIIGNTVNNNKRAGIGLNISSNNNTITGNTVSSNKAGIYLNQSSYNTLTNNNASNNVQFGIWLRRSPYNTLRENVMDHNGIINLILKDSPAIEWWNNDIDTSNTVNGLPVYYVYNQSDLIIDNYSTKRIYIVGCDNITVRNICFSDGDPLALIFTNNSLVENCTVSNNNAYGFLLIWSHYNNLTNNTASNNNVGLGLQADSKHNNVTDNVITGNTGFGIDLKSPTSNNLIYNNYFNNLYNARDYGNNIWNISLRNGTNIIGGSLLGGNYWSDYTGSDNNGDGLGDAMLPYNSSGGIQNGGDWLPLVKPSVFDTGNGTYPSIMGTHNGTIKPSHNISVSKLYTYPCAGTGGHAKHAAISYPNGTLIAEAHWIGYKDDWHNISFDKTFVLYENETYNYTIRTGSYPQIHHNRTLLTENGWINCTSFEDANGKVHTDWIPAIRLK